MKEHLQQKRTTCVNSNDTCELTVKLIEEVFDEFQDPFINLETTKLQSSFIQKNMNFVQPVQYILSQRIAFQNKGARRTICEKDVTMVYILYSWQS